MEVVNTHGEAFIDLVHELPNKDEFLKKATDINDDFGNALTAKDDIEMQT